MSGAAASRRILYLCPSSSSISLFNHNHKTKLFKLYWSLSALGQGQGQGHGDFSIHSRTLSTLATLDQSHVVHSRPSHSHYNFYARNLYSTKLTYSSARSKGEVTVQHPPKQSQEDEEDEEEKKRKEKRKRDDFSLPVTKDFFESVHVKNKEAFITALEVFQVRDKNARGHVEFIRAALKNMRTFGVHRDLETYKKLLDVFPKGRFVAQNMFQVEFMHYPKQQDCALEVLDQMEDMGVMPDTETQILLTNIFGSYAFPLRKMGRMMYWMPKFKNLSPWAIPDPLPDDALELAKLAIQRITSVDLKTQITSFNSKDLEDGTEDTWIVSGQSPQQRKLIQEHPADRPIYVEGAFRIWLSRTCINYFILRAEPKPFNERPSKDPDDVGVMSSIFDEDFIGKELGGVRSVHEQDDGVILAVCATQTSSRSSILSWLQFLQESNPRLAQDISILITLRSPLGPTDDLQPDELGEDEEEGLKPQIGEHPSKFIRDKDPHTSTSASFGFDPSCPELDQVGIGGLSDTRFMNWPHDYNPRSMEKREERRRNKILEEHTQQQHQKSVPKDKDKADKAIT